MKKLLFAMSIVFSLKGVAQNYPSHNINLISLSKPNLIDSGADSRRYSGCWGWFQASKNKEYAITGASNGTYFYDITSPATPIICGFMPGAKGGTYREMKTYQHYCYISSDDGQNTHFQIVDLQYLPDSIHVVYNDSTLFKRGHTIWIDQDKMYIGGMLEGWPLVATNMAVFSLANPEAPVLLRKLHQDYPLISYVHDMYVRNDTVYASCGDQGLYIYKYNSVTNKFIQLGSYTTYLTHGYNHSSFLTGDGKHLIFCDEVPEKLPIHFVNVENLGNIQPVKDFLPNAGTTPHNPYIKGNFAIVSCYQDGLQIYDISDPNNISVAGYFDTHPQGGVNVNNYGTSGYRGNWGAYPFLPSGIIIANDMQNGMFLLNANAAYNTTVKNPVGLSESFSSKSDLVFFPNPASTQISIRYQSENNSTLCLKNLLGQTLFEKQFAGKIAHYLDVRDYKNGTYVLSITENNITKNKKLIVQH